MTTTAADLLPKLDVDQMKMGDLKKIAKEIKRDHPLALELWASELFYARMLSVLIMDKNQLTQPVLDQLMTDLQVHDLDQRVQIVDWLMANQLMKSKKTLALLESWQHADEPLQRRLFWYHQGRLRWLGKIPVDNAAELLAALETGLETAEPEVQWAMNFTAGHIGVHDVAYRDQCIALGERIGLYKGKFVHRGCTPEYLPEFIRIEAEKAGK